MPCVYCGRDPPSQFQVKVHLSSTCICQVCTTIIQLLCSPVIMPTQLVCPLDHVPDHDPDESVTCVYCERDLQSHFQVHVHLSPVEGYHESRRCSRDTYPESCITKYTGIRRKNNGCRGRILVYEDYCGRGLPSQFQVHVHLSPA